MLADLRGLTCAVIDLLRKRLHHSFIDSDKSPEKSDLTFYSTPSLPDYLLAVHEPSQEICMMVLFWDNKNVHCIVIFRATPQKSEETVE